MPSEHADSRAARRQKLAGAAAAAASAVSLAALFPFAGAVASDARAMVENSSGAAEELTAAASSQLPSLDFSISARAERYAQHLTISTESY